MEREILMSIETVPAPPDLQERLRRRERELAAVHRITSALHARTNLDDLQRQTLLTACETVDAAAGSIMLYEPQKEALLFKYVINPSPEVVARLMQIELKPGQGIAGQVFQSGQARITEDVTADRDHAAGTDRDTGFKTRNLITVPLRTTDGQVIGVMQVCNKQNGDFDEADRQVLEILSTHAASAIETARLHEQARLAVIVNLIGDISHDVKNLVTPVVTGTQTLEFMMRGMFDDLDQALASSESAREVADGVRNATGTVREFFPEAMDMTYEGAQAVQERVREIADAIKGIVSQPHFELVRINEVVEAVAKPLRVLTERGGIALDLSELGETRPVEMDRKRMYNALYNLINNAIPETPGGGKISVSARELAENGEDFLEISVQDTGRGMPEHVRERLFSDQAVSTKVGGTGLGTRIVKNVVDAHRGTITVHSEAGRGTQFLIRIPARQPVEETEEAA